ncbi:MAG: orotidine 5'-phosphate decarboxylase, partial [Alphaproteobacteria bacterium]|nr:orotidine 5'-phosphate decarboxylase [Alphaproteobacteria bacterium]
MTAPRQIPVFCAIDTTDLDQASAWVRAATGAGLGLKFGKEFFAAHGPAEVRRLRPDGTPLFLDLKFHDIPNTVAQACAAATRLGVWMLNVHASGGAARMA